MVSFCAVSATDITAGHVFLYYAIHGQNGISSVAVENANQILKQSATYITDTAANDGVAKILEKLCLKED